MILSKFIDKTLDAAKQSALQIYGDDYSSLMQMIPDDSQKKKQGHEQRMANNSSAQKRAKSERASKEGVFFERSFEAKTNQQQASEQPIEKKLKSIRKYAAQQSSDTADTFDMKDSKDDAQPKTFEKETAPTEAKTNNNVYSRQSIRPKQQSTKSPENSAASQQKGFEESELSSKLSSSSSNQDDRYDQFVPKLPNGISQPAAPVNAQQKKQNADDIHQRLDRLESLMHLALSTPDATHSDHPLYHKLLHKGVAQKLLNRWFEHIAAQGIEPTQQAKLFHSKLLQQIDEELRQSKADKPSKVMLFAGRSGAGKTHLVMKLAGLPAFLSDKKVAVAFFAPESSNSLDRYSILEPFCQDKNIDFYRLENKESAMDLAEWDAYDHILIDTPSLEIDEESLIKHISTLQEHVSPQAAIETHYLVNTAINGTAFNDPLAQEVNADHLALTHIDKSLKWGKTVQLMVNTTYKLRYISSGPSIAGNLLPFDPEKFARKLLRA